MLDPDSPFSPAPNAAPLKEVALDRLRAAILSVELAPGMQVSEAQLCARYGLSKAAVRNALARLQGERLVHASARRGYTVAPITPRSLDDLVEARRLAEPALATLSCSASQMAELRKRALVADTAAGSGDRRAAYGAERAFCAALAAPLPNDTVRHWLAQLWDETHRAGLALHVPAQALAQGGCAALAERLAEGDVARTTAALLARIDGFAAAVDAVLRRSDAPIHAPGRQAPPRASRAVRPNAAFVTKNHQQGDVTP